MDEWAQSFGLPDGVELELVLGAILILMAIIVLVWLRRRINKKNSSASQHLGLTSQGGVDASGAAQSNREQGGGSVGAEQVPSALETPKPRPKHRDDATISKHMKIAELANDQEALAALYLERARLELSNDNAGDAGTHLRKSVMLATSHNLKQIHAEARLELAEIAETAGDMTTACEHWQMARGLFHELDAQQAIKETDTRMLRNGCPTDWVLTDF